MKNVTVIHHNDADGICAAAIVGLKHAQDTVIYYEADYAMLKTPRLRELVATVCRKYNTVDHVDDLYIVDFSLPEAEISKLGSHTNLHWCDHHKSAAGYSYQSLPGLRDFSDKGLSGCELAFDYCFPAGMPRCGEFGKVPAIVKLIGDYDSWRLKYENRSKPLITALEAEQIRPDDRRWPLFLGFGTPQDYESTLPRLFIEDGRIMTRYRDGFCQGLQKAFGFETRFEGLNCYALNIFRVGSMAFGDNMKTYDACIAFVFDGNRFTVSMYSENDSVDCSEICKKHGGGGHRGAAGFTCDVLPFRPLVKEDK